MSISTQGSTEPTNSSQNSHILPIPSNDGDQLHGNRSTLYVWDSSLPGLDNDTICSTDLQSRNITRVCCSEIGMESMGLCRMHNSTTNTDYFSNCTREYAIEMQPNMTADSVDVKCQPFVQALDAKRQEKLDEIAQRGKIWEGELDIQVKNGTTVPICGSVGDPDERNLTAKCCEKTKGRTQGGQSDVDPQDPDAVSYMFCHARDEDKDHTWRDGFLQCLRSEWTWGVCGEVSQLMSGGEDLDKSGAAALRLGESLLLAGTALALLA